jgi:hypothetical protein
MKDGAKRFYRIKIDARVRAAAAGLGRRQRMLCLLAKHGQPVDRYDQSAAPAGAAARTGTAVIADRQINKYMPEHDRNRQNQYKYCRIYAHTKPLSYHAHRWKISHRIAQRSTRSIIPPPKSASRSYKTADWPGVIDS